MLLVPTKLCLSALLRLSSLLSKRFGWLVVTALLSGVIVLLFECGRALGLSAFVSNSIHPCNVVGLLPSIYVYIGLNFLCVVGEWYLVK